MIITVPKKQFNIDANDLTSITDTVGNFRLPIDDVFDAVAYMGLEKGVEHEAKHKIYMNLMQTMDYFGLTYDVLEGVVDYIYSVNGEQYIADVAEDIQREYA